MSPPGLDDVFQYLGGDAGSPAEGAVGADEDTGRLIRPYAITRGRTVADVEDIPLEAQIQITPIGVQQQASYRWEAAAVLRLTQEPTALIEVAALAAIPIGVARVVIADLVADGAIAVQRITTPASTATYRNLLERVLDGVRSL